MRICASVLVALKWVSNNWWNSQLLEWPPHTLLAVTETLKWQRWDQASEWECASLSSLDDFQSLQLFWTQNIVQSFWKQMPNEKLNLNAMTLQWAFSPLNTYSFAIILTFSVHLSVYFLACLNVTLQEDWKLLLMGEFQAMLPLINSDPIMARNRITVGLKRCCVGRKYCKSVH